MEKSLNEGRPSEKGQDKVYVVILHFTVFQLQQFLE